MKNNKTQSEIEILPSDNVPPEDKKQFLQGIFPRKKSDFILHHAPWLYNGQENSWFATADGRPVGYCAVIAVNCAINGGKQPALWWVDLIIDPAYRGQGIQTLFDDKIRAIADLKLGIPNALAAKIHRKHNWGVREDGYVHLLPLRPTKLKQLDEMSGGRQQIARFLLALYTLINNAWGKTLSPNSSQEYGRPISQLDAQKLAQLFERYKHQYPATIYRDARFWRWRYQDAPYAAELRFFVAGSPEKPTHCLIARYITHEDGYRSMRILDWFGDKKDRVGLESVVQKAVTEAIRWQAVQVTVMNFDPAFNRFWQKNRFIFKSTARFCWYTPQKEIMTQIGRGHHWMLGDSDNDAPE